MAVKTVWASSYTASTSLDLNVVRVVTSQKVPSWWMADHRMFLDEATPDGYTRNAQDWQVAYKAQVGPFIGEIWERLPASCVLLCHEKSWHDCHRKVLWEMLREHAGEDCRGGSWGSGRLMPRLPLLF